MTGAAKVVLLLYPQAGYDRALLRGVIHYAHLHGPWIFHLAGEIQGVPLPINEAVDSREERVWLEHDPAARSGIRFPDLKKLGATGVIGRLQTPAIVKRVCKSGLPTVALDLSLPQSAPGSLLAGVSEVRPDSERAGRMAAEHYLERGFQHFAFCGYAGRWWSDRRREGFCQRLEEACFSCHVYQPPTVKRQKLWNSEFTTLKRWLESLPKPIGILACNDMRGRQVLEACMLAEIPVPDQVAVLGVDNDEILCAMADPPLSSIALDGERAGYRAAELLDDLMRNRDRPRETILAEPLRVVSRRSTDVIAVEDACVAVALQFIRDNAREAIGVNDVVAQTKSSRRSLEIRFQSLLGRTIRQEIQRARLFLVRQFLLDTDLPAWRIAEVTGFNSLHYLCRVFHREFGIPLAEYRRRHRSL